MADYPKLTGLPSGPPLVRRGVTALAVGVGLTGMACGGETTGDPTASSARAPAEPSYASDASEDATLDAESNATTDASVAQALDAVADLGTPPDAVVLVDVNVHKDAWMPACGIPPPPHH